MYVYDLVIISDDLVVINESPTIGKLNIVPKQLNIDTPSKNLSSNGM